MDTSTQPADKLAYNMSEVPRVSGLSRSTLYRDIAAGKLKASKIRGRTIITAPELYRYLGIGEGGQ